MAAIPILEDNGRITNIYLSLKNYMSYQKKNKQFPLFSDFRQNPTFNLLYDSSNNKNHKVSLGQSSKWIPC